MKLYTVEGAQNVRDAGGYPTAEGGGMAAGRFVRAGSLAKLTGQGRKALAELGVNCIIDLRSSFEIRRDPDALDGIAADYYQIPMLDYIQSNLARGELSAFPTSMASMYRGLLDYSQEEFRRVFSLMASTSYQVVLFHCTAGKDRTGMTAMLLQELAGVDDRCIVEDYAKSQELMGQITPPAKMPKALNYVLHARPETMRDTIDYLRVEYGGARGYLRRVGVTEAELERLFQKLSGEDHEADA